MPDFGDKLYPWEKGNKLTNKPKEKTRVYKPVGLDIAKTNLHEKVLTKVQP